jgi:FixJ family two-component response regulator
MLLDIHLGGIAGIELRRRLAAVGSNSPVIFMTAIDDEATRKEVMKAGCVAYLKKPFARNRESGGLAKATISRTAASRQKQP